MKMPSEIYVYVCDTDEDGSPIFAVAAHPSEIPEDHNGETVGSFRIEALWKFEVSKGLKRKS